MPRTIDTHTNVRVNLGKRGHRSGGPHVSTFGLSTVHWRTSTHSSSQGGQCIEIADLSAAEWRKSTRSTSQRDAHAVAQARDVDASQAGRPPGIEVTPVWEVCLRPCCAERRPALSLPTKIV